MITSVSGSFDFRGKAIDYTAKIFSSEEHRADEVEVEPSFGEDFPDFEDCRDEIETKALEHAYQRIKEEMACYD